VISLASRDGDLIQTTTDGLNLVVINEAEDQRHYSCNLGAGLPDIIFSVVEVNQPIANRKRLYLINVDIFPTSQDMVVHVGTVGEGEGRSLIEEAEKSGRVMQAARSSVVSGMCVRARLIAPGQRE
jgi:hypothetical protein